MVTGTQKALGTVLLVSALIYLFYHGAMTVANKFVVYEGGWTALQDITFWMTIVSGIFYIGYLLFAHPMKRDMRREFRKKVFTLDYLLLLAILLFMMFSLSSSQNAFPEYRWRLGNGDLVGWWGINRDTLMDTAGQILIMFPLGCWLVHHRDEKRFQWPLSILVIAFLVFETVVLVSTFNNHVIDLGNGHSIGMDSGLFLVFACHHNTTGLWGYCFLFLCIYLMVTSVKWLKPVYALGILINLVLISLSKSRTSIYANCLMLGLLASILFWYQQRTNNENKVAKALLSIAIGGVVAASFYFLNNLIYDAYLKISNIEELLGIDISRRRFFDTSFNTRTDLWKACFKVMFSDVRTFFFGVTPTGIYSKMNELANQNVYTHNQILEFGVGCGVPAMIAFIIFCVRKFIYSVRVCFLNGDRSIRNALPSIGCFLLLVGNMMEATLFGFNYISGAIFVVLCGFMTENHRLSEEKLIRQK